MLSHPVKDKDSADIALRCSLFRMKPEKPPFVRAATLRYTRIVLTRLSLHLMHLFARGPAEYVCLLRHSAFSGSFPSPVQHMVAMGNRL